MTAIAFQGEPGAYSHMAALAAAPELEPLPCPSFEDAFAAVAEGRAARAIIPIENSSAGRVADVHHLLPEHPVHIIGERFLPIQHVLMAPPGTVLAEVREVRSHPMALGQCRNSLRALGLSPVPAADTAGAAREVQRLGDRTIAALASPLAAELYGLVALTRMADAAHNTTRFVLLAREPGPEPQGPALTSFIFQVRNLPAALFKALGGFATNGVNMIKLESYQLGGSFAASQFYAEVEGAPSMPALARALEELAFFSSRLRVLGCFPADPWRAAHGAIKAE
jgi:prephenate dehydratase